MSSKNITGVANTGSVFITGNLELNELKVPTIFNKRIEQNKIELYDEDVVLSSKSDYTINYNDGNLGTTPIFNIKKNGTEKFIINDSGADVKTGEIFYNGTALRNVTEVLQNKSIDGNNNTITNIQNSSLPANVAVTDSNNNFSTAQSFSGVTTDSVVGKTNSNHALIFTNGLDAALESPDGVLLRYNAGGATTNKLRIRDHITNKAEFNNNGLNILDNCEIFYNGTELRNFTESLQNKTLIAPVIASIQPVVGATVTIPNTTDTLIGKNTSDVLTNKELTLPIISSLKPSTNNTISFLDESDEVVLRQSSQILLNKTLNSPIMTSFRYASNGPNISVPLSSAGNDVMMLRNNTETLQNKSISAADNTLTIASSDLTDTANIPLINANNVFSGSNTFQNALTADVNGNVNGNVTGNATSATQLQTTRTIAGESFNGTQNVTLSLSNLTDGNNVVATSSNNTFTANNTFNNPITGNITGNALNSSFTAFFGRLSGGINRPINNNNKFGIGPWRVDENTSSTGRRNTFSENMALSGGNTISTFFSLPSGIYSINGMVRIIDYEANNGELILFFSTNGNFSGSVNASYASSFGTRRMLQDQSITMNLNCCIKLQNTSTCALMMQPTVADTSGGFSVNERSWLSVVKIRDV